MTLEISAPIRAGVVLLLLLAVLLGGQAAADSILPMGGGTDTGRAIGDAGFAYLTGIRTAVAAILWNRLEPQLHEYYGDVLLADQTYVFPTVSVVLALDPQFEQAYYVAPWMLASRGDVEEGLELARLGTENIPESALMRANYAQLIAVFELDYARAAEQADIALGLEWDTPLDQHAWYGVFRSIYKHAGRTDMVDFLGRELERLDAELGDQLGAEDHDHDGDGTPDH